MWTCDDREPKKPQSIVRLIEERGVEAEFDRIDVGDYMSFDSSEELILVTRKSSDLLASVFDGHFSDELNGCLNMIESYGGGKLFFLLEGPWANYGSGLAHFKRTGGDWFRKGQVQSCDNTMFPNMQISLQTAGLFMVCTTSLDETAAALVAIWERGQEGWPTTITQGHKRPALKWSKDSRVSKLMGLTPKLPEKTAKAMIAKFGDIGTIVDEARKEHTPKKNHPLLQVEHFGPTLLKNLRDSLR